MKKYALVLGIIIFLAFVSTVSAGSPGFDCNAPRPTVADAQLRLQSDPFLYALAADKGYDAILVGAGSLVWDYCWGLRNNYKVDDLRWQGEYKSRINGFAEAIAVNAPFSDEEQLTFGYRLRMDVIGKLVSLIYP